MPADTLIAPGSSFTIRPVYGNGVSQWLWTPVSVLSCSNCANPVVTVREPVQIAVQVSNSAGCIATDSFAIRLSCRADQVFLPNTFTPNGDGMNDVWYPRGSTFSRIRFLRVFNRWGQLVFERTNFNAEDRSAGWDGKFKGVLLTPDVFVYSMGIICSDGQVVEAKGNVMIVR
jgi:gliding motility-associated-like protein